MNDWKKEFGPDEKEFLAELGTSFESLAGRHADCPKPELLLASQAGVLDQETSQRVAAHLEKCGFCRILARDLTDAELSTARPEEESRVRERVLDAVESSAKADKPGGRLRKAWIWKATLVVASAALAAVAVMRVVDFQHRGRVSPLPTAAVQPEPTKPAASVFQWQKLPIKLQASTVLVLRGAPRTSQEKYASALTSALAFYRDDKFPEAAERLSKVAHAFPNGVEGQLYLGISQLRLQQNAEAIVPLRVAQKLGPQQFRENATWFLALAYERVGKPEASAAELQKLCGGKSDLAARACDGLKQLPSP